MCFRFFIVCDAMTSSRLASTDCERHSRNQLEVLLKAGYSVSTRRFCTCLVPIIISVKRYAGHYSHLRVLHRSLTVRSISDSGGTVQTSVCFFGAPHLSCLLHMFT